MEQPFYLALVILDADSSTWNNYRPNLTNRTFTSAGETPGIRDAWPIVEGLMRLSFCRASIVSDCIDE